MKRIVTLIALITGLALVPVASASGCHAITTTPGYHDAYTSTIDVQVSRYLGMTCNRALRIGAAAYLATRSVGQFGFGDRPFHVGHCPAGSTHVAAIFLSGHADTDTDTSAST
jgi:hypothetical protein